jgi:hypothetical protein
MYYPIAVGGPLTEVVDGLVAEFQSEHPDIRGQRHLRRQLRRHPGARPVGHRLRRIGAAVGAVFHRRATN